MAAVRRTTDALQLALIDTWTASDDCDPWGLRPAAPTLATGHRRPPNGPTRVARPGHDDPAEGLDPVGQERPDERRATISMTRRSAPRSFGGEYRSA